MGHWLEPPPSMLFMHSGGRSGLPIQISHCAQAFKQLVTGVHALHFVGSLMTSAVHEPAPLTSEPSQTNFPLPEGNSQQPKQSHPFGVILRQKSRQVCGCCCCSCEHVRFVPDMFVLTL